ncbi:uncharacterized protein LOC100678633 isoform X2 [Nasonia vitripennis]|uniref:Uncharacterized protein n=1 Tax=Nasonia vitripennis TaxID=7425 RepID=A0A7M7H5G0_NASVI|nr:uncharacterized protein LOC100678633 isoform X2 [Nasonia vitripennis]
MLLLAVTCFGPLIFDGIGMRIIDEEKNSQTNETIMQRSPRLENPAAGLHSSSSSSSSSNVVDEPGSGVQSRIPSTLSVTAVDVAVACRQAAAAAAAHGASPSHSILTLTPGRTRNIDQDMEALRLSRQDNPYLQILASKESLIEPTEESESDDAILMSQEFGDTDSLTLAQLHEHMVRSPPPASWSRTPMFHFPHLQSQPQQQQPPLHRTTSPKSMLHRDEQTKSDGEIKDRHSHTFSLLNPTPIRSLSEVRRMHRSAEDSVQLMSSE